MNRPWTDEDNKVFIDNYRRISLVDLSRKLNRTEAALLQHAPEVGLRRQRSKGSFNKQVVQRLVDQGLGYKEIARRINMSDERVRQLLHKEGMFVLHSEAHKSAHIGIRRAKRYLQERGVEYKETEHPHPYDLITSEYGINVKNGAFKVDIERNNLERCSIGTIFLCFFDNQVYTLKLISKEEHDYG